VNKLLIIFILLLSKTVRSEVYPISLAKGFILTEAWIEGKNVLLILDTGAPGLILNQKYYAADQRQFNDPDQSSCSDCNGINGAFDCKNYLVREWSWLGVTHKRTNALVADLTFLEKYLDRKIHALVGLSEISDAYTTIDLDQQLIRVQEEISSSQESLFFRFRYANHLPVLTCKVNGKKLNLALDSGSEGNLLFSTVDNSLATGAPEVRGVDAGNSAMIRHRVSMQLEVMAGNISFPYDFLVQMDPVGNYDSAYFDGILGHSFLSSYNITIHPGKQKICLTKRAEHMSFASSLMP
jgi:hypothetical protein